ncbi:CLUMA_CG005809, isoform A [Clunio marinus]|uniref:CLUMA_CG005809, isoform A n=1 Tax=Clunio marinus TaxID=568069 RepID=A0A1J1I1J3_9DIPT|nr:CLUMA_CG005809, isoform A [Clunio marinus]
MHNIRENMETAKASDIKLKKSFREKLSNILHVEISHGQPLIHIFCFGLLLCTFPACTNLCLKWKEPQKPHRGRENVTCGFIYSSLVLISNHDLFLGSRA